MARTSERDYGTAFRRKTEKELPAVWTAYGKLVRLFREKAGLTQQALAEAIGYSVETVASVEQGRRPAKATFTQAVERVLKAGGALAVLQEDVDRAKFPLFFQDFAALEAEAVSRFSYDPTLIPGLLQTAEYVQALLEAHYPPLDDETIEQRVAARLTRQALLTDQKPPVVFVFVIEESAIRRVVRSPAVMHGQLQHLLTCAALRNVELQIMPMERGAHSGLNGAMVLLESSDHKQYVYVEAQDVVTVRSDRHEVSEFSMRHGMLRTQALNPEESTCLIERIAGEL
ncbi:helix-turn-helix transcriptional regulator [Streptomyces sp. NPDC047000]|uniref:helix-turn-helix domain-containing protein n=1 Tax=Streptomyces sp. NPDC047000 TaxID=3155474 RepID=UPI0034087D8B